MLIVMVIIISVMYDPAKVFELMADVSALLALASNMDIAANGTLNFGNLKPHFESRLASENAEKSADKRSKGKRAVQKAFLAERAKNPKLSARKFAMDNYKKYGYGCYESVSSVLVKRELDRLKSISDAASLILFTISHICDAAWLISSFSDGLYYQSRVFPPATKQKRNTRDFNFVGRERWKTFQSVCFACLT